MLNTNDFHNFLQRKRFLKQEREISPSNVSNHLYRTSTPQTFNYIIDKFRYFSLPKDSVSLSELKEEYLLSPCELVSMATGAALPLLLQVLVESLLATDIRSPSRFNSEDTSCALIKSRWRARRSRRFLIKSAGKHARLVARQQNYIKYELLTK